MPLPRSSSIRATIQVALDLSLCICGSEDLTKPGSYLIMAMGSLQAGLTGLKGSIV